MTKIGLIEISVRISKMATKTQIIEESPSKLSTKLKDQAKVLQLLIVKIWTRFNEKKHTTKDRDKYWSRS